MLLKKFIESFTSKYNLKEYEASWLHAATFYSKKYETKIVIKIRQNTFQIREFIKKIPFLVAIFILIIFVWKVCIKKKNRISRIIIIKSLLLFLLFKADVLQ